ncbi:MAG: class I SAM-dependent methyltransferase [Lachnospiraceae bacterium]|nr:class I SAM-dependent methyltransferase [Lachnospiraceae bacterium]
MDLKMFEKTGGIWQKLGGEEIEISTAFSEEQQNSLLQIEDDSWWFQYRIGIIKYFAKRFFKKSEKVYDIGGGNGYTSIRLQKLLWKVVLIEPSIQGCMNAKKRGVKEVVCCTIDDDCFAEETTRQVVCLDVLEHIKDDKAFLKRLYHLLDIDGKVILTVPADRELWSSNDEVAGHFRRYCLRELINKAEEVGFRCIYSNYYFSFLYLPVKLFRVGFEKVGIIKKRQFRDKNETQKVRDREFRMPRGIAGRGLRIIERWEEKKLVKNRKIKRGVSCIVVLEK